MAIQTTYSQARARLAALCDEVTANREVVIIHRRGAEDVALIGEIGHMTDQDRTVRIRKLTGHGAESDLQTTTPAQRLGMMWQLALDAWAFTGETVAESRLPRHVVRVVRGKR